jgi:cytidylate kinase
MRIVTLSRQMGSYGTEVAARVAETMGLALVGATGVHELAQSCDPEYRDACALYEKELGPGFLERLFFDRPSHQSLFEALTFEQAARGNVIIVGRGAQIVLSGVPGVFRVSLVASFPVRVRRTIEKLGISEADAEHIVRANDRDRDTLVRLIFDHDPRDGSQYDLILNTESFTVEGGAAVMTHALERSAIQGFGPDAVERFKAMALAKRIETLIRKRLRAGFGHSVLVTGEPGGVITLGGAVEDKRESELARQIALQSPGVTRVENALNVVSIPFGL